MDEASRAGYDCTGIILLAPRGLYCYLLPCRLASCKFGGDSVPQATLGERATLGVSGEAD